MSTFYAQYPASSGGSNSNPSIGVNGTTAPTSSTQVAGQNPTGNLEPLQTDAAGNLLVSLAAEPLSPLNTKDAADGTPGAAVPATAQQIAGTDGTNLRPLSTDSAGKLNINNVSGTVSLPTGASTSALQTSGNASLSSIDSKTPTLGQSTMSGSAPVTIASDQTADRKSTRLNSSHTDISRMPSSA